MRFWRAILLCGMLSFPMVSHAQWEVEADPTAYALSGYSLHVADAIFEGKSRLQLGAFAAETPEWVHGNSGWTEKSHGVTFKFDYFPSQPLRGLFIGLDSNYARVRYTLQETNEKAYLNIAGLGPRIGYRFELGEDLYISPWFSVDYQVGAKNVIISGKTFEPGKLAIFPAFILAGGSESLSINPMGRTRHLGITLVAIFAVIAGLGEIVVGFTGNYLGILAKDLKPNVATAMIGAFYSLGGLSLLTMKKWGAVLGILFISAEILGRVYLVMVGIAPSKGGDTYKIVVGGAIALAVILYVRSQWKEFD